MMTPEEARSLIKADSGSTHGPQTYCHSCKAVKQHAWQMTHQIANLEWEWRTESTKGAEFASSSWADEKEARDIFQKAKNGLTTLGIDPAGHVRLVRRLVSQPEVMEP